MEHPQRGAGAEAAPGQEHVTLSENYASRCYFRKFEVITAHLARVAGHLEVEGRLSRADVGILTRYVAALGHSLRALGFKYLMAGRDTGGFVGALRFDAVDSGFPVFDELLFMANDAQQVTRHLSGLADADTLKDEMVRTILADQEIPTRLQFALSQRLYYEELQRGQMFWTRNDPDVLWQGDPAPGRRRYLMHWAVYDSQLNLPTVYLMDVEDSGKQALPKDQYRWPEVQAHLMGQSLGGLKLVTIARAFDQTFDNLHPKRLRRFHIGPMYSHRYTAQAGPLREVLADARSPDDSDWALAWTLEELESERVTEEKSGWFSTVEREVFALDPFSGRGVESGATRTERMIILPERPYQVLEERRPPGFAGVRKFVVGARGRVLSYR